MVEASRRRRAYAIALLVPAALLAGAYVGQYAFGLPPCEMCWWQRYPHFAAIPLAGLAWMKGGRAGDALARLAALALAVSGAIGGFHAGVEYGWWQGLTSCAGVATGGDALEAIMNAPLVRCDVAPWELFGVSLAGWNFLISLAAAMAVIVLLAHPRVARVGTA